MERNLDLRSPLDVVVIGGGLAGLVAGITAANEGSRVAIVDSRSFGGRARSADRDGFVLNEGGHALYRGAGGWAVLESLGVRPEGATPDPSLYRVLWGDEIRHLPTTPKGILTSRILGARSKAKFAGWLGNISATIARAGDVSLDDWLDGEGARPDLRRYVTTLGRLVTYAARPGDMPVAAVLGQFAAEGGVVYVDGGWQTIVDALVEVARSTGVALVDHQPVTSIEQIGPGWSVSTRDHELRTTAVVLAAGGPQLAVGLLGDDPCDWVDRAGPMLRAACLDVGGRAGDVAFLQGADAPMYLSAHTPAGRLAPDGETLYSVMRYLAHDDPNTMEENRAALEHHAARAGLPSGGERRIERFLAAPVVAWGSPQVGVDRPTGLELGDRGVYAAGDWIGRPLLADASLVSGATAGTAAAERAMVAV